MAPPSAAAGRGLVLWLHGSAETGEQSRAQVAPYFSAVPELRLSFPTAPTTPIACYGDEVITAWFGIPGVPITATTVRDEKAVLKAVEHVHEMINKEVAGGTSPTNIFVCGLSQGGALAIASVLLYPQALVHPLNKLYDPQCHLLARKTPVLWFHGMADGLVLFEAGHAGCAFLQELGMTCEFKAYPALGGSLVDEELHYFRQWILERLGISQGTETARPSSPS